AHAVVVPVAQHRLQVVHARRLGVLHRLLDGQRDHVGGHAHLLQPTAPLLELGRAQHAETLVIKSHHRLQARHLGRSCRPAGASAPAGGAASGGGMHSATACPRRTRSPARSKSSRMCSRPAASTPSRRAVSATASPRKPGRLVSSYKFSQASTAGPPTTGWYTVNSSRGTASGHSRPPSAVTVHWTGAAAPSVVISQILPPGNVVTRGRLAPAAPLVPLQAQLDQTVDQFRVRQAGGFP